MPRPVAFGVRPRGELRIEVVRVLTPFLTTGGSGMHPAVLRIVLIEQLDRVLNRGEMAKMFDSLGLDIDMPESATGCSGAARTSS